MIRIVVQYIVPLLFPAALYIVWSLYHKKRDPESVYHDRPMPWVWLFGIGFVLMALSLVTLNQVTRFDAGGTYVPPTVVDGEVVPGHVIYDD